jgi:hypothetical protein
MLFNRDEYIETSSPIFITPENLLLGLEKSLEWAEKNKTAKISFSKDLPPQHDTNLSFHGFEYGGSLVFVGSCPVAPAAIASFVGKIKTNLENAYQKALDTNVDQIFN